MHLPQASGHVCRDGTGTRIFFEGELDLYARDAMRQVLYEGVDGARNVTVDLTGVAFLDSTALAELVRFRSWLLRRGCELSIACPRRDVLRVFEVTGLDRVFVMEDPRA